MSVGENIRRIRKIRGLTQKELGKKLGISQAAVGQYEKSNANLTQTTIQKIANALDVTPSALINEFCNALGENIKSLREEKNISISDLAKLTGISEKLLTEYEENITEPYPRDIERIAYYLDKEGTAILGENLPFSMFDSNDMPPEKPYESCYRDPLSLHEQVLLANYRKLNDTGKEEARKRVQELTEIEKYKPKNIILNGSALVEMCNEIAGINHTDVKQVISNAKKDMSEKNKK